MKDRIRAHLHDILLAGRAVRTFLQGRNFQDYASDEMLRSAVERKFEIMGEALNRIRRQDPDILTHIRDHRDIISFRNILIHGYDTVDERIVWDIAEKDLDHLIADTEKLLQSKT